MKIKVSLLQPGQHDFHYEIPKSKDLQALADKVHQEQRFLVEAPFTVDAQLTKIEPDYYLRAKLAARITLTCSRCAETFKHDLEHGFEVGLVHDIKHQARDPKSELAEESDDLDIIIFSDNELNLAPIVEEQLYLSIPFKPLCRAQCAGICQKCGTNLNDSTCQCAGTKADGPFATLKELKA